MVTNVPGPQFPRYVLGRRMQVLYPVVPLARRQALGIAVLSYDGHLGFGLLGDFDALPDLETIGGDLEWAIASLSRAAGVRSPRARRAKRVTAPKAASEDRRRSTVSSNGAAGASAASAAGGSSSSPHAD